MLAMILIPIRTWILAYMDTKEEVMGDRIEEYVKTIKEIEEREGLSEAKGGLNKVAMMNLTSTFNKVSNPSVMKKIEQALKELNIELFDPKYENDNDRQDTITVLLHEFNGAIKALKDLKEISKEIRQLVKEL